MIWLPVVGDYADIDVYASIVAYTDLLNQRGKPAKSYIPPATPNYSIPDSLRLKAYENDSFDLQPDDEVIILDMSTPSVINSLVPDRQILELIDHHPGYEAYWRTRLGDKAIIEKIGAVATSVFEWWGACWHYEKMTPQIAKLLLAAILDNTLYFNAEITTQRDLNAATKLAKLANTAVEDFAEWYFAKVNQTILNNLEEALLRDCKKVNLLPSNVEITFGQLTAWSAEKLIAQRPRIMQAMASKSQNWIVSIICLAEHKNYLLASSQDIKQYFAKLLNCTPDQGWLITNQLFLRKEIIAKMLNETSS